MFMEFSLALQARYRDIRSSKAATVTHLVVDLEQRGDGRPRTAARHAAKIRKLHAKGLSKAEIARRLSIGRASVIRILAGDML